MTRVYVLSYSTWGHHSLAFYQGGVLTEFTYGDWELFALNRRSAWIGWKNMTFRTEGALGRKSTPWRPGQALCANFKDCEAAFSFLAPTDKVTRLRAGLREHYAKAEDSEVYNDSEGVHFVKFSPSYWLLHNCNHELAVWLELLGAQVSGRLFYKPSFANADDALQTQLR